MRTGPNDPTMHETVCIMMLAAGKQPSAMAPSSRDSMLRKGWIAEIRAEIRHDRRYGGRPYKARMFAATALGIEIAKASSHRDAAQKSINDDSMRTVERRPLCVPSGAPWRGERR